MIITSCPLRISLVGGSTDHPHYIEKYNHGAVISFPSSLRTYVSIHQDVFGTNSVEHLYNINYSKRESVKHVSEIQNEMIRYCFEYLNVDQMNCNLTSDIFSVGSGLAASSSYLQALIKSIHVLRGIIISDYDICKIAEKIEKKFNPLVGQQDFYGSLGKLKRIDFFKGRDGPEIKILDADIFNDMDIYLSYTGVIRNSTTVLESLDISKSVPMMQDVGDMEKAMANKDKPLFNKIIRRAWLTKKSTSNLICDNPTLIEMDNRFTEDHKILSHKLCGAGNGGYFLLFTDKGADIENYYNMTKKISVSEVGLKYHIL